MRVYTPGRGDFEAKRADLKASEGGQAIQRRDLIAMASSLANTVTLRTRAWLAEHKHCCEATWKPAMLPFKYGDAPVLVANNDQMMGGMKEALRGVERTTLEAKFSSRFRTRKEPLNDDFPSLAEQIAAQFDSVYGKAKRDGTLAKTYDQALPWPIKAPDRLREETYHRKLDEAGGVLAQKEWRSCRSRKRC